MSAKWLAQANSSVLNGVTSEHLIVWRFSLNRIKTDLAGNQCEFSTYLTVTEDLP